jgi:integrase
MKAHLTEGLIQNLEFTGKQYDVYDTAEKGLILRVNAKKGKAYTVQYERGGRIKIADFGGISLKLARLKTKEIITNAQKGQFDKNINDNLTYEEYLNTTYYTYLQNNTKRPARNVDTLKIHFKNFLSLKLSAITPLLVEKWKNDSLAKKNKATTINRNLGAFKSSLERAVEFNLLKSNPVRIVKRMKIDKKGVIRYFKEHEKKTLEEILPSFPKYFQIMVLVARHTGLRKEELLSLEWSNVFFDVPSQHGAHSYLQVNSEFSKNGDTDTVPLNRSVRQVLFEWKEVCEKNAQLGKWVFTNPVTGKKYYNIRQNWDKLRKLANLRDENNFRWHDLRHDFASQLAMKGVPIHVIKDLMRHKTVDMTFRYAHLAPKTLVEAVNTLD